MDTGRKWKIRKMFRRRPGHFLNILCTFNVRSVSRGLWSYEIDAEVYLSSSQISERGFRENSSMLLNANYFQKKFYHRRFWKVCFHFFYRYTKEGKKRLSSTSTISQPSTRLSQDSNTSASSELFLSVGEKFVK